MGHRNDINIDDFDGFLDETEATEREQSIERSFEEHFGDDTDDDQDEGLVEDDRAQMSADERAYDDHLTHKRRQPGISSAHVRHSLLAATDARGNVIGLKNSVHNITTILNRDSKIAGAIALDLISGDLVATKSIRFGVMNVPDILVGSKPVQITKAHKAALAAYIGASRESDGYEISVTSETLGSGVMNAGALNAFDPLVDEIRSQPWDGNERLDTAWIRWFGLADNEYHRQAAAHFMVSFIERRFKPGNKFDYIPVLVSKRQGTFKSTAVEVLAMGHYGEFRTAQEISDPKKMIEATQGAAIMEVPELSAMMSLHHNVIKGALSSRKERARGAYAENAETRLRSFLWFGTSNDASFLRDPTGNRRFWPLMLDDKAKEPIDIELMRSEIQQVYAEALVRYREMRAAQPKGDLPLFLTGKAAEIARHLQENATVETPEQSIAGWLTGWLTTPYGGKFSEIELDGDTYRSRFCMREAWMAYNQEIDPAAAVKYDAAATKSMTGAIALVDGVSRAGTSRFDGMGAQAAYAVDPEWLRAQLAPQTTETPEAASQAPRVAAKPTNVVQFRESHDDFETW